jgi:hypothetical protein
MHIYIYDSCLNQKKYGSSLAQIETRITDLGLSGKIIRLGVMKSVNNIIESEIKKGAKTLVAVGESGLFIDIVNTVAKIKSQKIINTNVPVGFIPTEKNNLISETLGLSFNELACDVLSARRIQTMDLGRVNNNYFLFQTTITTKKTTLEIDDNYTIEVNDVGEIGVINLPLIKNRGEDVFSSAGDGVLELFIKTEKGKKFLSLGQKLMDSSLFSFKKLRITNPAYPVVIDGTQEIKTPVDIIIAQEKIDIIVGKNRMFN